MGHRAILRFAALAAFVSLPFACGGRNLNAFLLGDETSTDDDGAGGGDGGAGGLAAVGAGGRGGVGGEGGRGMGGDPTTGPSSGPGGPQDCIACAATNCPEALECFADQVCRDGLACGVTQCLGGGGGPDLPCFLECFDGDADAAFKAFQALTCVFMSCGDQCAGFLGGGFPGP